MSRGKFWKLAKRLWLLLRALSEREKLIAIYCMTEQTNRVGLFPFSSAKAADDLGLSRRAFEASFRKVCDALGWQFDPAARVLFLTDWWRYNDPGNRDAIRAFLQDLLDVPPTPLMGQFLCQTADLSDDLRQVFEETVKTLSLPASLPASPPGCPPAFPPGVGQGGGHTRLDETRRDKTRRDKTETPPAVDEVFEVLWKTYPDRDGKKTGREEAKQKFKALSAGDRLLVQQAVEYYADHIGKTHGKAKDLHRFLRDGKGIQPWREWLEPATVAPSINEKDFTKGVW